MTLKSSLLHSQEHASGHYPEPDKAVYPHLPYVT